MIRRLALAGLAWALAAAAPAPVELRSFKVKAFAFAGGRTAPIKLGYRTLGSPHRGADGLVDNAVVLLHGTGGTGADFLGRKAAGLVGPGAPLDPARSFVILPDAIGSGGSSKPSDSLGVNFPHYDYADMVGALHLLRDELKLGRIRLVVGVSMGAMLGWTWAEAFPGDVAAVVALGAWPVAVGGRNLLWRLAARDALLASSLPGGAGARVAAGIALAANVPPALLAKRVPDAAAARAAIDAGVTGAAEPVDIAFQLDAVRGYAPEARLGAITATVVAVNIADDPLYPPDADPLPAAIRRNPRISAIVVPASPATSGHATFDEPAVWLPYAAPAIRAAVGR